MARAREAPAPRSELASATRALRSASRLGNKRELSLLGGETGGWTASRAASGSSGFQGVSSETGRTTSRAASQRTDLRGCFKRNDQPQTPQQRELRGCLRRNGPDHQMFARMSRLARPSAGTSFYRNSTPFSKPFGEKRRSDSLRAWNASKSRHAGSRRLRRLRPLDRQQQCPPRSQAVPGNERRTDRVLARRVPPSHRWMFSTIRKSIALPMRPLLPATASKNMSEWKDACRAVIKATGRQCNAAQEVPDTWRF